MVCAISSDCFLVEYMKLNGVRCYSAAYTAWAKTQRDCLQSERRRQTNLRRKRQSESTVGHVFLSPLIIKPRPHQQQCRSDVVECYKSNDFFDKVKCCYDIVANNIERNFVLLTKSKQVEHVHFVLTLTFHEKLVWYCCNKSNVASTLLLVWTRFYMH